MARKSSKPAPVDRKALKGRITAYQKSVYEENNLSKLFFTILDDGRCDPTPIFNYAFPLVRTSDTRWSNAGRASNSLLS